MSDQYEKDGTDALAGKLHHEFGRLIAIETEELERLTANRDQLEREQGRLMQAHYADAIPLSVLKREQDRIAAELDKVTRRIDAHYGDYADAPPTKTTPSACSPTAPKPTDGCATKPSSPRSSSTKTMICASSKTDPSKCCSIRRSMPTP